jgi:hypothetical protein
MSDFYQILKREIEPDNSAPIFLNKEDNVVVEKKPVENLNGKIKKSSQKKNKSGKIVKEDANAKTKKIRLSAKKSKTKKNESDTEFLNAQAANPIWLTMSETAKLGGVQKRTIKRALRSGHLKYRIVESRYQVDFRSALLYFFSKKKLWNKLMEFGIGQYVEKWKN